MKATRSIDPISPRPPTPATAAANRSWLSRLPFSDTRDFENARRGFLGALDEPIRQEDGAAVWDPARYAFLDSETSPDSVHPSLWRQARLNRIHGLFQVADRVYQVRGIDIANVTFIEGDAGLIVVDPLTTAEGAKAALELYFRHRPRRDIRTIVYTHSHADHFGGVRGIATDDQIRSGDIRIVAPAGFVEEAVSENVLAGPAMGRRALYQFGQKLDASPLGTVDAGLGKASTGGTITLINPTLLIGKDFETHVFDGVEFVFQLTPETEAPAELHFYLPEWKALNTAENATHNLHNLLPLRGAKARDAKAWSQYLNVALERFGREAEIVFAQHHWPIWGNAEVVEFLGVQRDIYKHLHDQTLKLANQGYVPGEIAEMLELPPELENSWSVRGLYGSVKHNAKAIHQRYLGWYDGNPAHLDPLPPVESAKKWLEYAGGAAAVLARAQADYEKGRYRWVAEVLDKTVHADPENTEAKALLAAALEQLGYQAESATWRNAYLQGAKELREGVAPARGKHLGFDLLRALDAGNLFDALALRLDSRKARGKRISINWHFTDIGRDHLLSLERSTLSHLPGHRSEDADVSLKISQETLRAVFLKQTSFVKALATGKVGLRGNPLKLHEFFGLFDEVDADFAIVTPRPRR